MPVTINNSGSSEPRKPGPLKTLDYSNSRIPNKLGKHAFLAGRISLYAIVVQILWGSIVVPWYFVAVMELIGTPLSKRWCWAFFLSWPTFVGLAFAIYSVKSTGFIRRNAAGIVGLLFSFVVAIWVIINVILFGTK